MNVNLLYEVEGREGFGNGRKQPPKDVNEVCTDLNLDVLFQTMSVGDDFIKGLAKTVLLTPLTDRPSIYYRQDILKDCMAQPAVIREVYRLAASSIQDSATYEKCNKPNYARITHISARVINSVGMLEILLIAFEHLKNTLVKAEGSFLSKGLRKLCETIISYLDPALLQKLKTYVSELKLLSDHEAMLVGASIGLGAKGSAFILRSINGKKHLESLVLEKKGKNERKLFVRKPETRKQEILLDNISLVNAAKEIQNAALINLLEIINHFSEQSLAFFRQLREETGFYVGCLNMHEAFSTISVPLCFPVPRGMDESYLHFEGLVDGSLALKEGKMPVQNDLKPTEKRLFLITGANQGGKSTFLRSLGIAQLLMQGGVFVPALSFTSDICDGIYTHFTREEDAKMNCGKLAEELSRMNTLIDQISPHSLLLMNESFSTTTEREGSRIAEETVLALYENHTKILFVTHLFEFAERMAANQEKAEAVFLRAVRSEDGHRSFKLLPGEALKTSFGIDLYNQIMEDS